MRATNLITGGTIVGALGMAGVLLAPVLVQPAKAASDETSELPQRISLTGHIRDFPPNNHHVDFQVNPSATPGARSACNIRMTLDDDRKPVFLGNGKRITQEWRDKQASIIAWCQPPIPAPANEKDNPGSFAGNLVDNGGISSASSFEQWFRDVPGVNMSRLWTVNLDRQGDGTYVYDNNNFNPIDHQLFGNGNDEQNFYFTYEIVCTFTAAPDQFLEFKGDDDFWAFIVGPGYEQGELVIDHGGIASNRVQYVNFNRYYPAPALPGDPQRCKMQVGLEYKLHLFFAERCQPQSQFRLRTNITDLKTAGDDSIFAAFD